MNANSERILRYLSELMDENEKHSFERELKTNPLLSNDLDSFRKKLDNFNVSEIVADERYFSNLLPKVRGKIESHVKSKFLPRLAFGLPTIAAVVIAGIVFIKTGTVSHNGSTDIVSEIVDNIDDEIVSSKYISDIDLDVSGIYKTLHNKSESQELNYDETTKNKILAVYDYPVNDELLAVQHLSNEELTNIYSKIAPKNY